MPYLKEANMDHLPIPSGNDVYWEKWTDAFEEEEEVVTSESDHHEHAYMDEEESVEESFLMEGAGVPIKGYMTPFGLMPLTEQSLASKHFKFWVGHSNFKLTHVFYKVIGEILGIETLDIMTPYRFRIGIGKMFKDRTVMVNVREKMLQYIANGVNTSGQEMSIKDIKDK